VNTVTEPSASIRCEEFLDKLSDMQRSGIAESALVGIYSGDCAMSVRGNTVLPSVGGLRELSHRYSKFLLEL